jgi:hypothetical protein
MVLHRPFEPARLIGQWQRTRIEWKSSSVTPRDKSEAPTGRIVAGAKSLVLGDAKHHPAARGKVGDLRQLR